MVFLADLDPKLIVHPEIKSESGSQTHHKPFKLPPAKPPIAVDLLDSPYLVIGSKV